MLPRRCKSCRCYIAPQLDRCPRCRKRAPAVPTKPTKEEKVQARVKRDAKVPTIHAKNMHWIPSAFSMRAHTDKIGELRRRLERAESPALRNVIRNELRLAKATLARASVPSGKKGWTSEIFHAKQSSISVFISPKKHRYVLADKDGPADLIIIPRAAHRKSGTTTMRLVRFERSGYAKMVKKEKQETAVHSKRKKVKKEARAKKRQLKDKSPS